MEVKTMGSTHELLSKLLALSSAEVGGIPGVAVECVDIGRNTSGEGGLLGACFSAVPARRRRARIRAFNSRILKGFVR